VAQNYRRLVDISSGEPVIDSGRMRHSITIERDVVASPPEINEGGVVSSPQTITSANAAFETYNTADQIRDGQITSHMETVVAMWYQPGILGGDRVIMPSGNKLIVQEVDNVLQMDIVLVLTCTGLGTNV